MKIYYPPPCATVFPLCFCEYLCAMFLNVSLYIYLHLFSVFVVGSPFKGPLRRRGILFQQTLVLFARPLHLLTLILTSFMIPRVKMPMALSMWGRHSFHSSKDPSLFFFLFSFRLYDTYSKEQGRWSEVVDRKKSLLTYLARVSHDKRDKEHFHHMVKEMGETTGSLLTAWIL